MTERPTGPVWLGFTKRALIVHGVLALFTLGIWLLVPAGIYTWRRGGGARKLSYGLWGTVGLIGLLLVISVVAGDETEVTAAQDTTPATTQAGPATTAAEREDPPTTTTAAAEPPDTGRMSEGEYALFSSQLAEVDDELFEYGEKLQKCGVLMQALQLADASECVTDAFSGVESDMLGAYTTAEGYEGDVAKACLKALKLYKERLDIYYGWQTQTKKAGENLQFDEFTTLASLAPTMSKRYRQARDWALRDCAPR